MDYFSRRKKNYMKNIAVIVFILWSSMLGAQNVSNHSGAFQCHQAKINRFKPGKSYSAPLPKIANALKYNIHTNLYHCFLPPYPNNFDARLEATFLTLIPTDSLQLNAENTSLVIESVGLDASSFTHVGNILTLHLNQVFQPGDTIHLAIDYEHLNVTDHAFYASNGHVFTDCEPEGARKWFPCYDSPDDKALFELTAGTTANVKLGSNGILADSAMVGDTLYYHWVSNDKVATYIMVLSAYNNYLLDILYWPRTSNPADSVQLRFYYQPGENPQEVEEVIMGAIEYFSKIFCDHPFPKNGFATVGSEFTWGGMENQTLTSLCPNCWSEYLAVHEFAHQWFGDMITCKTWADIWLNEGFATYSESLWAEHAYGYDAYKQDVINNANYYLSNNPGWAISNPDWAINTPSANVLFNYAITYTKGASIHHMLRYTIGDSLYFEVLNQYAHQPNLIYESAEIQDFIDVVNSVTGDDYTWFFEQWLYQPNHPVYNNVYWIEQLPDQRWRLTFTANQIQNDPPYFKMPIELRIIGQNGLDTNLRVMNTENNQSFVFESSNKITKLFFDFNNNIVLKQGSTIVGEQQPEYNAIVLDAKVVNQSLHTTILTANRATSRQLKLFDITGKTVADFSSFIQNDGTYDLNIKGIKPGLYILKLHADQTGISKKIIIR